MAYTTQEQASTYKQSSQVGGTYSSKHVAGCCNRGCRPCVKDFI